MEHLVIGEAQAQHLREYARSWELATSARPHILGWRALLSAPDLPADLPLSRGPLLVRFAAPSADEIAALAHCTVGELGDVEWAGQALSGLLATATALDQALTAAGHAPRYASPPAALQGLLDRAARQRGLRADSLPQQVVWPVAAGPAGPAGRAGSHVGYEALRERLRQHSGQRAVVRLSACLGPPEMVPTVVAWLGGRGIRAQANCRFTPQGAARAPLHAIEDEAELRPILGRLFELGATVEEEWPAAEISGRPFVLSMLVAGGRVVLGDVGPAGPFRVRGGVPEHGVPRDVLAIRRQMAPGLYDKMEEAGVRLCRLYRCAALVVDVALSRRFDRFAILDVDPFAELPGERRDATGWSAADHLCRAVRLV